MALIACTECNQQISDKAAACPHCGAPTSAATRTGSTQGIVTTQQTSKGFKIVQAIGAVLMTVGLFSCFANVRDGNPGPGGALFVVGFLVFFVGRVGAWWRNG